jgi:transcriptional regulator with XRE-family HTH domain
LPFYQVALPVQKPLPEAYPKTLKTLGDHLRKRRLDLKLLQKQVGERLGASAASVYNWESGMFTPSIRFIPRIVQFLGYHPQKTTCRSFREGIILNRRRLGLSQKKLAHYLSVDPGTLSNWERDNRKPPERFNKNCSLSSPCNLQLLTSANTGGRPAASNLLFFPAVC